MDVNKLAGWCLIILAAVNVLHEIFIRYRDGATPGIGYAFVTALFFTLGAVLLIRKPIPGARKAKVRRPGA
ncbi:MAG TPA: hypothetical protein VFT08_03995 [Pyrinomonadaceae bacterium]|nr:hypothetical protein [Pyrinomonadaceae bacterium]